MRCGLAAAFVLTAGALLTYTWAAGPTAGGTPVHQRRPPAPGTKLLSGSSHSGPSGSGWLAALAGAPGSTQTSASSGAGLAVHRSLPAGRHCEARGKQPARALPVPKWSPSCSSWAGEKKKEGAQSQIKPTARFAASAAKLQSALKTKDQALAARDKIPQEVDKLVEKIKGWQEKLQAAGDTLVEAEAQLEAAVREHGVVMHGGHAFAEVFVAGHVAGGLTAKQLAQQLDESNARTAQIAVQLEATQKLEEEAARAAAQPAAALAAAQAAVPPQLTGGAAAAAAAAAEAARRKALAVSKAPGAPPAAAAAVEDAKPEEEKAEEADDDEDQEMDGEKLDEKLVKLKAAAKAAPANKRVAEQLQNALDVHAKIAKDAKKHGPGRSS